MKNLTGFVAIVVLSSLLLIPIGQLRAAEPVSLQPITMDRPPTEISNNRPDKQPANGPPRYRVILLRNIAPRDAIQLLADVNITDVTQLNDSNTLLVSGPQEALLKATNLMDVADSKEKYVVKTLMPAGESIRLPKSELIAAEITRSGTPISIGTFFNLPGGTGYKAILDIHEGTLVAIAPVSVMDKLVEIVERAAAASTGESTEIGPPLASKVNETSAGQTAAAEPNALFKELLGSIDEAQKEILTAAAVEQQEPNALSRGEEEKPPHTAQKKEQPGEANVTTEPARDLNELSQAEAKGEIQSRSYEPKTVPNADETLDLALPEKLEIIPFLDLVGKYLNLNYVYNPTIVGKQEVYLKVQGPIKVGELYPLAESVLKFTGLAMTRKGNLVTITTLETALDIDPAIIETERGQVKAGDIVITRIFQLNYIETAQAKALLEGMRVGAVTEIPATGTLIITGYAFRMSRIEELLNVIDKPGRPKQFKFRQLKYTMAQTLAPKIKTLVEQLGDISIALSSTAPTPAQPPGARRAPRPQRPVVQPTPTPGSAKPSIYLDADERTNRILMIGQEVELTVVNDLIDALDVAQQDLRALRVYEMQHVDALEVKKKLEELGIIGAGRETAGAPSRITGRAGGQGQPGGPPSPTPTQPGGAEGELPTEEMQVVVIESTNSLMVNASPEQHALIATIISYVDSESIQQAIPYVVYPLQNQPPEHVAEVLQKLIQEIVQDKEGKIQTIVKKTEENIIIVPDPSTFSLIVYANKKNQDWISNLIKSLDRRRPQVLIDVTLVEVTNIDAFDLDLQLASKFPKMIPGGNMDFLPALIGGAGDANNFLSKRSTEAFVNGGAGQGFYSDRHIQALLTALETKNYGRVLAKPKILVNDGQKGVIRTTDTTNVKITGQTLVGGTGDTSIVTSTTYQPYNAGIMLEIQPNIGEGDLLLLIVKLDRTDFLPGRSDTSVPPDTRANTVDTIVTVPNNRTIILGGLLKLNQGKGGTKVPLLGDIPIVGGLFRSTANSVNDSKLYVFVKAIILRPETALAGLPELERISERNRAAFEKAENDFQQHQDWPGVKPTPVDPVHVLDAE